MSLDDHFRPLHRVELEDFRRQPPAGEPRRYPPVPPIRLVTGTGSRMSANPKLAAYLVLTGSAELVGELSPEQQAAYDAAVTHYQSMPAHSEEE